MARTLIEWADFTFNPWIGCTHRGPECLHCYAEAYAKRVGRDVWGPDSPRPRTKTWADPRKWNAAAVEGEPRPRVFCASLADVLERHAEVQAIQPDLWQLIESCPRLLWLLLTKRPENAREFLPARWFNEWPQNVALGTTVGHENSLGRLSALTEIPCPRLFVSVEPLLQSLDLTPWLVPAWGRRAVGWVIAGGESGPGARPMAEAWALRLRDQCEVNRVPFLFKQWGDWSPDAHTTFHRVLPVMKVEGAMMTRVGKVAAGRQLDGGTYDALPNWAMVPP